MKKQLVKITTIVFIALSVIACKKAKNETEAKAAEEVSQITESASKFTADAESSTIAWKGFKPTGEHNGTIKISEGYLAFEDGNLSGGNFVIDMNTIVDLDIESEEYNTKLVNHLKSADFFNVEANPYSVFAITGVDTDGDKVVVKGNLTIKGIKKNIEFPATVAVNGHDVTFTSETFTIDRTEWDIKFRSGKFFEDLKDKLINDDIELSVVINAKQSAEL